MNARFNWLWTSAGLSNLADGIIITALPLIALTAGASPGEVALVTTAATIAWPLAGLHAGWVADKLPVQRLLMLVNGVRALSLVYLALSIAFEFSVTTAVLVSAFTFGLAETLVDTALMASIPRTVSDGMLTGANARIEATVSINNQLAGPPLAGLLIGTSGLLAAISGSVLYALAGAAAIGLMSVMKRSAAEHTTAGCSNPSSPVDHSRHSAGDESAGAPAEREPESERSTVGVLEGLRFLWRHRLQRELTLMTAAMSVVWGAWTATFVLYVVAPGPLGLDSVAYGLLLTGMAIGGIAASMLTQHLRTRLSSTSLLFIDTLGTTGLLLPAALNAPLPVIAAGITVAGAGSTVWRIIVAVIRQQTTPLHLIGRVYSASRVISWGALPLGASLAALGVETLSLTAVFWVGSVVAIGVAAWFAMRMPRIKYRMEETDSTLPARDSTAT